jgi:hypothetical protein
MGRKKLWMERLHLTLAQGAKAAISVALLNGEDVLEFVRTAIDRELVRRGHDVMPPPANEPPAKAVKRQPD